MSKPTQVPLGAERHVNLSGNTFSFSMPENFSPDMPAEPLIEHFNIDQYPESSNGLLIQRWWDIKEPGFFGKGLGTIMMSINAHQVPQNTRKRVHATPYNIENRLDLILLIDESIHARYADDKNRDAEFSYSLPSIAALAGSKLETEYRDRVYGKQKWTSYSIAGPHSQLIVNNVLPINNSTFLEVSFTYSPNSGVAPRHFLDFAYQVTHPIEESFLVEYKNGNPIQTVVEQTWINRSTDSVLRENQANIILPLFGPKIHKQYLLEN
ncbi:MAG: hypothetical protein K6L76_11330 [Agarilytica sp.]